jgi:4-hydroxybenzoate polyprenyltransferase
MSLMDFVKLMRPYQWYKNALIFLPLIFVKQLFNINAVERVVIGFLALCLLSSTNYILNDIVDRERDRHHPEKKNRPIASGKVSVAAGLVLAFVLLAVSVLIGYSLSNYFLIFMFSLFALTQLYSYVLKTVPFIDIILIGVNFILRAMSGAFIIFPNQVVRISPWLILCPFFLALFLATGKRLSELKLLGKKAILHKEILKYYSAELSNSLLTITTTSLLICYALFSFNSEYAHLIYTLPFAAYVMFRYMYLAEQGSEIARKAHLLYKDTPIMIAGALWVLVVFGIIYLF